jgi:coproporphyrinogen III oxidase
VVNLRGMKPSRSDVEQAFRGLRDRIVARLEALDGGRFKRTNWERPGGGGGEMSELRGELFEKGGCNFSAVHGERYPTVPEGRANEADLKLGIRAPQAAEVAGQPFFATGVSLVLHPRNPFVPVVHLNVRYIEVGQAAWFGGGTDLTPFAPFEEDTAHFHETLRKTCGDERYARFSQWAREYFFITHRNSERGVGGIFFDYLRSSNDVFHFVRDAGDAFLPAYVPLVEKRRETKVSETDRQNQLRWRGRYVEFNLIYDRGTLFGLKSGGNVEAIFMSLPPLVAW